MPDFTIITPSYNMLSYLKLCSTSVADQDGVDIEHIVVDGASTDGSVDWLKNQNRIKWISEKDKGMYDALNKGFKIAKGELIGHLNCDEQYLPGTLNYIKKYFDQNPCVDVIFGDFLAIDPQGDFVAYRKSHQPYKVLLLSSYLYVFTCAMFLRRKIIDDGLLFNTSYRSVGDLDFVLALFNKGYRIKHVKKYFSVFMITGNNLMNNCNSLDETDNYIKSQSRSITLFRHSLNLLRLLFKLFSGAYFQKYPLSYSIYTSDSFTKRKKFTILKASFRWPK